MPPHRAGRRGIGIKRIKVGQRVAAVKLRAMAQLVGEDEVVEIAVLVGDAGERGGMKKLLQALAVLRCHRGYVALDERTLRRVRTLRAARSWAGGCGEQKRKRDAFEFHHRPPGGVHAARLRDSIG
jgi:hypothetical protein